MTTTTLNPLEAPPGFRALEIEPDIPSCAVCGLKSGSELCGRTPCCASNRLDNCGVYFVEVPKQKDTTLLGSIRRRFFTQTKERQL